MRCSRKFAVSYGPCQPAVHTDVLPRDVAGVFGEEERCCLGDLCDRTPPPHWYRLSGLIVYLETLYVARQNVVHPYTLGRVAVGVELREASKGSAQGGGEREGGGGLEGREGGDVDHGAASLPEHRGRHQTGDAHDVQHDQVEGLVPLLVREIQDLSGRRMSGAVDHRVDTTVPVEGPADKGLQVVLLRDRAREAEAPELLR